MSQQNISTPRPFFLARKNCAKMHRQIEPHFPFFVSERRHTLVHHLGKPADRHLERVVVVHVLLVVLLHVALRLHVVAAAGDGVPACDVATGLCLVDGGCAVLVNAGNEGAHSEGATATGLRVTLWGRGLIK